MFLGRHVGCGAFLGAGLVSLSSREGNPRPQAATCVSSQCKRVGYLYGTWVKEEGGNGIAVHAIFEPKQVLV